MSVALQLGLVKGGSDLTRCGRRVGRATGCCERAAGWQHWVGLDCRKAEGGGIQGRVKEEAWIMVQLY